MKHLIPKSFIQEVITRTDIVNIIGSRLELKKRGSTHVCRCPFHNEKTPSFTVSTSKQFYYCFGCSAHGDAIGFLMAYDHLPFVDAVTHLAQQLGLSVPFAQDDPEAIKHHALYALLNQVQIVYQKQLSLSQQAIAYLKSRGLTGDVAKKFVLGYAPANWDFLRQSLIPDKDSDQMTPLLTTGMLIKKNNAQYYDRFRDRIMFPIRDLRGRTVGFGGRVLNRDLPKYLNSPETPIFHKNQIVYGLYEANQNHRELKRVLVVEGYLDVISLVQQGIDYAVATLGTALNVKHIQTILRYTSTVIFCFDGDIAGKKAALRALTISLPLLHDGLDFKFLFLPETEDPDSLIRKTGREKFETCIDGAENISDVFFSQLEATFSIDSMAGKAAFAKKANALLQTMPTGIYKNLMLEKLAEKLALSRQQLSSLENTTATPTLIIKQSVGIRLPKANERLSPAQLAIHLLLQHTTLADVAASFLTWTFDEPTVEVVILRELLQYFRDHPNHTVSDLFVDMIDEEKRRFVACIAMHVITPIPKQGIKAEFQGALSRLYEQNQATQLSSLIQKAKTVGLDSEEKQGLQKLLMKKQGSTDKIVIT